MRRVATISRFIAHFPEHGPREELTHTASRVVNLGLTPVRREPYLLAVAGHAAIDTAETLLDVFPGTAASARLEAAQIDTARSSEDLHAKAEESAQCYNLLQPTENAFVLESDALALKPVYTARAPGGHVMG